MPIASRPVKMICKSCGWHLITNHPGDYLTAAAFRRYRRFNEVLFCGHCGSEDLECREPSLLERLSPWQYVRKLTYMARKLFRQ